MTKKDSWDSELTDSEKFGLETMKWSGIFSLFNPLSWIIAFPFLGIYTFFVIDEKKKKKESIKDEKEWEEEKKQALIEEKRNEISIKKRKLSWEESVKSLKNKYLKNSQYWETSIGLKFETLDYWNPLSNEYKICKELEIRDCELFELLQKVKIMIQIINDKNNKVNNFSYKDLRIKEGKEAKAKIIKGNILSLLPAVSDFYQDEINKSEDDYFAKKRINQKLISGVNVALVGLEKAVENFDVKKNKNFKLYADWWIKQSLLGIEKYNKRIAEIDKINKSYFKKYFYICERNSSLEGKRKNKTSELNLEIEKLNIEISNSLGIELEKHKDFMTYVLTDYIRGKEFYYLDTSGTNERLYVFNRIRIDAPVYGKKGTDFLEDFYSDYTLENYSKDSEIQLSKDKKEKLEPNDISNELYKLGELKEKNLISKEEFEKLKLAFLKKLDY